MNNLVYIYKLWLSIAKSNGILSTSDVLLASKRLVEGYDDSEIISSINEFENFAKNISLEETIEYLYRIEPSQKYIILINLFMVVMLKNIHNDKVDKKHISALKDIYTKLSTPYLYDILYLLMNRKYAKAHKLINNSYVDINFVCFDQYERSEINRSFKQYQVHFIILKIENFYLLLNSHSHDLKLYANKQTQNLSLYDKCQEFKKSSYEFVKHKIRDHSIYYLDKSSFIRIDNGKQVVSIDASSIEQLFSSKQSKDFLITEVNDSYYNKFQCPIGKDHIYNIKANHLYVGYNNKQEIDKDVNFDIQEGELVAIMGPSGSGKTTLLRAFVKQAKILKGELKINNEEISKKYFHRMGYVPQDDVLIKDLSVYDNMYYYYRLHFGKVKSDKELDKLISNQLRDLGILEIKNQTVFKNGKYTISGGQRKRLNIALELLKDVDLILMDEPTSGLSSLDSEKIIKELKRITRLNKIVIINIHQPSNSMYRQFDKVIVFDEYGHNIYTNKSKEVLKIFKLVQTEDTYMFNEPDEDKENIECMKCDKNDPEILLEIQDDEKSNFWNLFSYLNNFANKKTI